MSQKRKAHQMDPSFEKKTTRKRNKPDFERDLRLSIQKVYNKHKKEFHSTVVVLLDNVAEWKTQTSQVLKQKVSQLENDVKEKMINDSEIPRIIMKNCQELQTERQKQERDDLSKYEMSLFDNEPNYEIKKYDEFDVNSFDAWHFIFRKFREFTTELYENEMIHCLENEYDEKEYEIKYLRYFIASIMPTLFPTFQGGNKILKDLGNFSSQAGRDWIDSDFMVKVQACDECYELGNIMIQYMYDHFQQK